MVIIILTDCSSKDLQGKLRECTSKCEITTYSFITISKGVKDDVKVSWKILVFLAAGRIDYEVDLERKEVHISVSDMLEDRDYHVRLCHKDYICTGTGAHILVNCFSNIYMHTTQLIWKHEST